MQQRKGGDLGPDDFVVDQIRARTLDVNILGGSVIPVNPLGMRTGGLDSVVPGGTIFIGTGQAGGVSTRDLTNSNPYLGANQTLATNIPSAVATIIIYNVAELDTHAAYSAVTGRYTIPVGNAGRYLVCANVNFAVGAVSGDFIIEIFKNGAPFRMGTRKAPPINTQAGLHVSALVDCIAGDILDARAYQTTGAALNTDPSADRTWMTVHRMQM